MNQVQQKPDVFQLSACLIHPRVLAAQHQVDAPGAHAAQRILQGHPASAELRVRRAFAHPGKRPLHVQVGRGQEERARQIGILLRVSPGQGLAAPLHIARHALHHRVAHEDRAVKVGLRSLPGGSGVKRAGADGKRVSRGIQERFLLCSQLAGLAQQCHRLLLQTLRRHDGIALLLQRIQQPGEAFGQLRINRAGNIILGAGNGRLRIVDRPHLMDGDHLTVFIRIQLLPQLHGDHASALKPVHEARSARLLGKAPVIDIDSRQHRRRKPCGSSGLQNLP